MTGAPRVLAVDLSLTATGLAGNVPGLWTCTIKPKTKGHQRLADITGEIYDYASKALVDLVIIEGPSYGSGKGQQGHHERAGLWWHVTWRLWRNHVPLLVMPPTAVKVYATGKGNADKDTVLIEAIKRWPDFGIADNNQADAATMLAAALDHADAPLCDMPKTHRRALDVINAWPQRVAA
jgi:Holliday junction resolvasome RuvABC endonuclease subunit